MRRCKCQITGEWGTVSTFYKVRHKGRNLYYKNEATYLKSIEDKKKKAELNTFVANEVLNYDNGQYLPPLFLKKINELNKLYPMDVITETFKRNKDDLQYWMSQDSKFSNEYGKISYMIAIIKNNINNEYEKWKIKQRRDRVDNTVNVDVDLIDIHIGNKKSDNGISDFL